MPLHQWGAAQKSPTGPGPAGTFPGQEERLKDQTHHNAYGAYELARCVVRGIQDHVPELAERLLDDVGHFDPTMLDDPAKFTLPQSPHMQRAEKPAGN